jgi:hypothetical protein
MGGAQDVASGWSLEFLGDSDINFFSNKWINTSVTLFQTTNSLNRSSASISHPILFIPLKAAICWGILRLPLPIAPGQSFVSNVSPWHISTSIEDLFDLKCSTLLRSIELPIWICSECGQHNLIKCLGGIKSTEEAALHPVAGIVIIDCLKLVFGLSDVGVLNIRLTGKQCCVVPMEKEIVAIATIHYSVVIVISIDHLVLEGATTPDAL